MRLALLGDIHFFRLLVPPWKLCSKRVGGQLNLYFNRQFTFKKRLLELVLRRIERTHPDLLLLSGDLTTTALAWEFQDVLRVGKPLFDRVPTLIVPGNHDRYTFESMRKRVMERELGKLVPASFPHFQSLNGIEGRGLRAEGRGKTSDSDSSLGPRPSALTPSPHWHLLVLDAAVPRWADACGKIGEAQLAAAQEKLSTLTDRDGVVILCHYPLAIPPSVWARPAHDLIDLEPLRDVLRACKARILYLHGHVHKTWAFTPPGVGLDHVIDINAGSPCQVSSAFPMGQGFVEIDLPADPQGKVAITRHIPQTAPSARPEQPSVALEQPWDAQPVL